MRKVNQENRLPVNKWERSKTVRPVHPYIREHMDVRQLKIGNQKSIQLQERSINKDLTFKNIVYPEVIQAYFIEWDEGAQTINNITLDRPPNSALNATALFPGWEMSSSHTTAFVVIRRDLELRLKGKTFNDALHEIKQLTRDIRKMPGYEVMPDKEKIQVELKIYEISNGIEQVLRGTQRNAPTSLIKINRNVLIKGYAEEYFICRNSIYYTFHVAENGGGAANEAGNMRGLESAVSYEEAREYAIALLDKNYIGGKRDFINIARQHFLSIASFFEGQGKLQMGRKFINLAKSEEEMLKALCVKERKEIIFE